MKKHLNPIKYFGLVFISLFLAACSESSDKEEYVAKVNESFLTESQLEKLSEGYPSIGFSREEIIDHWIREEILYQEAVKKGIVESDEYKIIIGKSEKELAGTMLLNQSSVKETIKINNQEIEKYYNSRREEFRLNSNSYVLNLLKTNENLLTVDFRSMAVELGWKTAVDSLNNDSAAIELKENFLVKEENLSPQKFSRIVQGLYPPEISIVISDETGYHSVVQVLNVINNGGIIPLEFVKNEIESRLMAESRKEMMENYVKSLYKKYDVELNN